MLTQKLAQARNRYEAKGEPKKRRSTADYQKADGKAFLAVGQLPLGGANYPSRRDSSRTRCAVDLRLRAASMTTFGYRHIRRPRRRCATSATEGLPA